MLVRREAPGLQAAAPRRELVVSPARRGATRAGCEPSPRSRVSVADGEFPQLAGVQRARILSALVATSCERGAGNVSVADIVARSGVSRRTFYEQFVDREECFVAAFEQALAQVGERVRAAANGEGDWRERVRAGLIAFLAFLEEEPLVGRLLLAESQAGGPRVVRIRNAAIAQLTAVVEEGRRVGRGASDLPAMTGEGIVGGALAVIQARLVDEGHASLMGLVNPLMSMIVMPYLGAAAARRELKRAVSSVAARSNDRALPADPFKELGMRLTYRTVRVLAAIAEAPGASNRTIGDAAGIEDQGQISKLLGRLQRAGLVTNSGMGGRSGAPNAWALTSKGEQLAESIRLHVAADGLAVTGATL